MHDSNATCSHSVCNMLTGISELFKCSMSYESTMAWRKGFEWCILIYITEGCNHLLSNRTLYELIASFVCFVSKNNTFFLNIKMQVFRNIEYCQFHMKFAVFVIEPCKRLTRVYDGSTQFLHMNRWNSTIHWFENKIFKL